MTVSANNLIAKAVVWESAVGWTPECLDEGPDMLVRYRDAGFSFLSLTIGADWDRPEPTFRHLSQQRRWFEQRAHDYQLIETVADIRAAKQSGKMAIGLHLQGAGPAAHEPAMIDSWYRLGIRWMIVAYNTRNPLGDGCHEPSDAGLSMLGRAFVAEANRVGMMLDASHAGINTSLDIIELSEKPVVFSHSSVRALKNHERNIDDVQIKALARRGGVVGINSIGAFLTDDNRSDVPALMRHIDYVAQLVGPEHVGLGLDTVFYQPFMTKLYDSGPMMALRGYPRPPWADVKPEVLPELVEALERHGYSETAILGVLGENFLRVAEQNWRPSIV
ncbi:membrane dipeptidase [Aminobacter anthyllidis]|uniref:Membrane dipeptidase n=1 Tax=Aminobacter anthyllidis TaxID=1035067 RepID=A0A9X1AHP0_9HYPH|nr:membrane dipeptidase [Aminobacter anthyllidis]MBT1159944.1 membrane dipeptidase [Aminobacter anthyllidis]MDH4986868.1 membrane dipeptidase [Aminobacter anthyllidis]